MLDFLPSALRPLLSVLLIFTLTFTPASPFINDAHAVMKQPPVPTGISIMKYGFFHNPNEVADFDTHYGLLPITVPSPIPAYGRRLWCYGPIYVCYLVGCSCIPLPYNWCEEFPQCFATNILNLEATLLIKHAWPEVGERMKDASNLLVIKPDYLYRDLCVQSGEHKYSDFDRDTGELIIDTVGDTYTPADSSRYDERGTGHVVGAKPAMGTCMPRINTKGFDQADPTYSIPTNGNTAFSYFMNANNEFFRSGGDNSKVPTTIYGTSNRYLSTTFFLGGNLGCPDDISGLPKDGPNEGIAPDAKAWKEAAKRCYDYFIFARATHPEWTLERPGTSTDDPLTKDTDRGGNPELSIFNNCQPLMSGIDSRAVSAGLSPIGRGYAPVLQYQRPDLDEADYSPREMMQRQYAFRFPGRLIPDFKDYFPCVRNMGDAGPYVRTNWDKFNLTLLVNYGISFAVETSVLRKKWGPQYFKFMSSGDDYVSRGVAKKGFCPNIEKINVPTNPFAPRNDIRSLEHPKGIAHPDQAITPEEHFADLLKSAYRYIFDDGATDVYFTDREYSYMTSWFTPEDRWFNSFAWGYSDYLNPDTLFSAEAIENHVKHPEVMCAVVPVDILEPRRKSFNNCIMERINFNFTTWRRRNFLSYYYSTQNDAEGSGGANLNLPVNPIVGDVVAGVLELVPAALLAGISAMAGRDGTLLPWTKPCVTRFYENDTIDKCPVSMSIQQCCRIIVKDVVPMNYVKIRTCEGLRQKRDIIFGFDHVYDYAERVSDSFKDDWAISIAKTEEEKAAANEIIYTKTLDAAVPVISQGGTAIRTPTNQDEYDALYKLNQKLTMIGCDNTEPDTYRFSTYFSQSPWQTLPAAFTVPINDALERAQQASDDIIQEARDASNTAVNGTFGPISAAWDVFNFGKRAVEELVAAEKAMLDEATAAEQLANGRFEQAEANFKRLGSVEGLALIANGNISPEMISEITEEYATAKIEKEVRRGIAQGVSDGYDILKEAQELQLMNGENIARDAIVKWFELRDKYIIANGKNLADRTLTTLVNAVKATGGQAAANAIDTAVTAINAYPISALSALLSSGSEGGSHMPYMRRWDTGTSAGNPLHGGSFINTLGSYDVIIGVGNEERTFNDATDTTTDIKTVQDQSAIAEAYRKFQEARIRLENARRNPFNELARQMRELWGAGGSVGTMTIVGDNVVQNGRVNAEICTQYKPSSECQALRDAFQNIWIPAINRAKADLAEAEAALQEARRKSITTVTTSSSDANIPPQVSLTQTAHMGRIDGWDGLKGHQMLSLRRKNLSCIGRYERLFQGEGAENFVLHRAGAGYQNKKGSPLPWPLAWRGYVADPNNDFEKNKAAVGLDNAQAGDIAIYTMNGMKRIAYVSLVNQTSPQFVKLESWDHGKFPTSTGASVTMGTSIDRYVYKTAVPTYEKIDDLDATKAAKINGQPSCEDPYYTSCIMGGTMDLFNVKNELITTIPNSKWDDVIIYRPSLDTAQRQCPMINIKDPNSLHTQQLSTDSFSFCTNAGFDPPPQYVDYDNGYHGPGAGNISDATICGPNWGSCKVYSDKPEDKAKEIICFPGREICSTGAEAALPPIPPDAKTNCTEEEYNEALKAFQEDSSKVFDEQLEAGEESKKANAASNAANAALSDYIVNSKVTIANAKATDATNKANAELIRLNTALADANQQLADAQAIVIPAPIVTNVNGVPTVTNQAEIDAATTTKTNTINRLNAEIVTINANIVKQNNILTAAGNLMGGLPALDAAQAAAVAARNDLADYIAAHPILDTMSDAEQKIIADNITRLAAASNTAATRVGPTVTVVNDLSSALDGLFPPNSNIVAQQAAANAEIQRLQGLANTAVGNAEDSEEEAQEIKEIVLPKMACPYVPLDTTTTQAPGTQAP